MTERAYGSLLIDYFTDDTVIMNNKGAGGGGGGGYELEGNQPPELRVDGPLTRSVKVGEPLQFAAYASDDGIPEPRALPPIPFQFRVTPDSASGLWVSWFVYRGEGADVKFSPKQISVWEDGREARELALGHPGGGLRPRRPTTNGRRRRRSPCPAPTSSARGPTTAG